MKRILLLLISTIGVLHSLTAQNVGIKTNTLYWLTTTPNLGVEFSLDKKLTFELTGAYNPWTFKNDKKMHFWLVQPEIKYWTCEKFNGHFIGLHLHGAQYFGGFSSKRYDGYLVGGGGTYGYDWILSPHWNLEAAIGIGYAHLWYKESERIPCAKCYEKKHKNYFGPTKVALTLTYFIF
ncbi:DUF3575 domain-containing protein [Bacteroides faecichinchillae]|uniref:DUF3575 domain-containing protein n=1 Tax=Bacteroides faecichinchillae TaxID=871325 RepID=UPI00351686AB